MDKLTGTIEELNKKLLKAKAETKESAELELEGQSYAMIGDDEEETESDPAD